MNNQPVEAQEAKSVPFLGTELYQGTPLVIIKPYTGGVISEEMMHEAFLAIDPDVWVFDNTNKDGNAIIFKLTDTAVAKVIPFGELRFALDSEVVAGVAEYNELVLSAGKLNIDSVRTNLEADKTVFDTLVEFHQNALHNTIQSSDSFNVALGKYFDLVSAVEYIQSQHLNSIEAVNSLVRILRADSNGATIQPNYLQLIKDSLVHILTRFALEGHSGFTASIGLNSILDACRKLQFRKEHDLGKLHPSDANRNLGSFTFDDLLKVELEGYEKGVESIVEIRNAGNIAFYPVFDMTMYPSFSQRNPKTSELPSYPLEALDTLIGAMETLIGSETLCYPINLDTPESWNDVSDQDEAGNKGTKLYQNKHLGYIFHEVNKDGTKRTTANSRVIYCGLNDINADISASHLGNSYTRGSGLSSVNLDETLYYGKKPIIVFVDEKDQTQVVKSVIKSKSIESLDTETHQILDSNLMEIFDIHQISAGEDTSSISIISTRNGLPKTITAEEFANISQVALSNGQVINYADYVVLQRKKVEKQIGR